MNTYIHIYRLGHLCIYLYDIKFGSILLNPFNKYNNCSFLVRVSAAIKSQKVIF